MRGDGENRHEEGRIEEARLTQGMKNTKGDKKRSEKRRGREEEESKTRTSEEWRNQSLLCLTIEGVDAASDALDDGFFHLPPPDTLDAQVLKTGDQKHNDEGTSPTSSRRDKRQGVARQTDGQAKRWT